MFFSGSRFLRNIGLLILRVSFGLYMAIGHGWGKIVGGPERWSGLGQAMEIFGIGFAPTFWGFMASFAEFACALLLVIGLFTRPALLLLTINMGVAATSHIVGGDGWVGAGSAEMALLYGFMFLSLLLIGPGKYSMDRRLRRLRDKG